MHTYEVYRSGNPDHPPFVVQIVFRAAGDAPPVRSDLSQHHTPGRSERREGALRGGRREESGEKGLMNHDRHKVRLAATEQLVQLFLIVQFALLLIGVLCAIFRSV